MDLPQHWFVVLATSFELYNRYLIKSAVTYFNKTSGIQPKMNENVQVAPTKHETESKWLCTTINKLGASRFHHLRAIQGLYDFRESTTDN